MKTILFSFLMLVFAYVLCFSEGPLFRQDNASVQQEFENVYQDIRMKISSATFSINCASVTCYGSTLIPNSALDSSSVTLRGNAFNGNSQLVQLDSTGALSLSSGTFTNGSITNLKVSTEQWKGFGIQPILQTQSFTTTTSSASQAGVFENTNLQVTITPKLSTSKIIIWLHTDASTGGCVTNQFTLTRNGTNLGGSNGFHTFNGAANNQAVDFVYYDSPGSTSALTYALQTNACVGFPTTIQANSTIGSIIAQEIAQ